MVATANQLAVKVQLPQPHGKQAAVLQSTAKRKVVLAGRRGGKTVMSAIMAVQYFLRGKRVLYAAPTQDQTDAFWNGVTHYLGELTRAGVVSKNETKRILEFSVAGRGRIRAETCWDPDSLRGDYADLLILDEFSVADPRVWTEVGAPMLLDTNGDCLFIFTPKRKNHAYKLYLRARADQRGRWAAWHFTSYDNPFLDQEALAEIVEDMTEEEYAQEIMAEFLEDAGQVFRNIDACMHAPVGKPDEHEGHVLVAGVDWGKKQDYTVISVGCASCRREVHLERFNAVDYTLQVVRLQNILSVWKVLISQAEVNAMGEPLLESLQKLGVHVIGFTTTSASKPGLIENLALNLERGSIQFLPVEIAKLEMEAYEVAVNAVTGKRTYSAPKGMHDDTVIARALMLLAINQVPREIQEVKNNESSLLDLVGVVL